MDRDLWHAVYHLFVPRHQLVSSAFQLACTWHAHMHALQLPLCPTCRCFKNRSPQPSSSSGAGPPPSCLVCLRFEGCLLLLVVGANSCLCSFPSLREAACPSPCPSPETLNALLQLCTPLLCRTGTTTARTTWVLIATHCPMTHMTRQNRHPCNRFLFF